MKRVGGAIGAAGLAFAVLGAVVENFAWVALGLAICLCGLAALGFALSRGNRTGDLMDELSPNERAQIVPLRKLRKDIEAIASTSKSETVRVIATEALEEADHILDQAAKMASARGDILKALASEPAARREADELRSRLADSEGEPGAAEALEAREREFTHYESLRQSLHRIEGSLRQAEATLAEVKARLSVSAAVPADGDLSGENLREGLTRLRALSVSFDEAEQLLEGRTG